MVDKPRGGEDMRDIVEDGDRSCLNVLSLF